MSIPLCHHIFPNRTRCRAAARAGFRYCRHHTPEAIERRRLAGLPPEPPPPPPPPPPRFAPPIGFSSRRHWRIMRRAIAQAPASQFQLIIHQLMIGLERNLISHRCAGALLHEVQKRRRCLRLEAELLRARSLAPDPTKFTEEGIQALLDLCLRG